MMDLGISINNGNIKKRYIFLGGFVLGIMTKYTLDKINEIITKKVVNRIFKR